MKEESIGGASALSGWTDTWTAGNYTYLYTRETGKKLNVQFETGKWQESRSRSLRKWRYLTHVMSFSATRLLAVYVNRPSTNIACCFGSFNNLRMTPDDNS